MSEQPIELDAETEKKKLLILRNLQVIFHFFTPLQNNFFLGIPRSGQAH